jgi:hypothetical protein
MQLLVCCFVLYKTKTQSLTSQLSKSMSIAISILLMSGIYAIELLMEQYNTPWVLGQSNNTTTNRIHATLMLLLNL